MCTDTVGRVLALGGSRVLDDANDVLREVTERIPDQPVALHAAACLATASATARATVRRDRAARPPRVPERSVE
ncbi:hypothetical protein GCM10018779_29170 [Streptomyces griseocarneus]|nr:hypothetical protein GCM10018779_29170 [Streptomyces griseocarneus]